MSAAQHTVGPWTVEGPDWAGDFNILPNGGNPAIAAVVSNLRHSCLTAANARLIAAAPDLLEALIAAHALGCKVYHNGNAHEAPRDWATVKQLAETAIAKATGAP